MLVVITGESLFLESLSCVSARLLLDLQKFEPPFYSWAVDPETFTRFTRLSFGYDDSEVFS